MSNMDLNGSGSWYSPLQQETAPVEKKKKRKLSTPWRTAIIITVILALIVGSSMLLHGSQPKKEPAAEAPFDFSDDMPDSAEDFFRRYFTPAESDDADVRLEKAEEIPDFQLELSAAPADELNLQQLYESCAGSTVAIKGFVKNTDGYFWGTGIILSEDGLILTNTHVIEGCDWATVTVSDDTAYDALLVGADKTSDLAVLKIDAKGLPVAQFGDSSKLAVGDHVAAIGNPLGETFRRTLTDGIISAIERGINYNGHTMNLLQTNTALNEGNSGGGLFNMYGQVIGVTNMKMMSSSFSSIEGIGFAIPSSTVVSVVNALIKDGEVRGRPAIGLTVGAIPDNAAEHYELPGGLYVSAVSDGSDAKEKGIRPGDIVTAVNGIEVFNAQDILDEKEKLKVGDTMTFTIWRDGQTFDVDVVLVDNNDIY